MGNQAWRGGAGLSVEPKPACEREADDGQRGVIATSQRIGRDSSEYGGGAERTAKGGMVPVCMCGGWACHGPSQGSGAIITQRSIRESGPNFGCERLTSRDRLLRWDLESIRRSLSFAFDDADEHGFHRKRS